MNDYRVELVALVGNCEWLMRALLAVQSLGLSEWCIGAGAIRNLVWDARHGRTARLPADIDVAYFDPANLSSVQDQQLQARLIKLEPEFPWEVTNQAAVHLWFEASFGHPVLPLHTLEDAVASWPEYATAVGVSLSPVGNITIIDPHGLDDLFNMVVRRNPARVSPETYRQRIAQKDYQARWPEVRIIL